MIITDFLTIVGIGAIYTAIRVITSSSPVNSVWNLVLVFANVTIILFYIGVEYMGIILWIIYVGAIAILLLFVLKLLNIRLTELKDNSTRYVPVGLLIGIILFTNLNKNLNIGDYINNIYVNIYTEISTYTNIEIIGIRLFEELGSIFIIAGYILLLAMVGAIILTLGHEGEIKRQDIFNQINRE